MKKFLFLISLLTLISFDLSWCNNNIDNFAYVKKSEKNILLKGKINGFDFSYKLKNIPENMVIDRNKELIYIAYRNRVSLIEKLDMRTGDRNKFFAVKGYINNFDLNEENLVASVNKTEFGTNEIRLYDLRTSKSRSIIDGGNYYFFNHPVFLNKKEILYVASHLPDPEIPKFNSMTIYKKNLEQGNSTKITGGISVFDEKGNPHGFKASMPCKLSDYSFGFLKIIGYMDKYFSVRDFKQKKEKNILGPDKDLTFPKLYRDKIFYIKIIPGNTRGLFKFYDIETKKHFLIDKDVIKYATD